jgi:hypothetical protein
MVLSDPLRPRRNAEQLIALRDGLSDSPRGRTAGDKAPFCPNPQVGQGHPSTSIRSVMGDRTAYWHANQSLDAEFVRLEQQASLSDPMVRIRMSLLGLRPGMRCLEVGPGTGSPRLGEPKRRHRLVSPRQLRTG